MDSDGWAPNPIMAIDGCRAAKNVVPWTPYTAPYADAFVVEPEVAGYCQLYGLLYHHMTAMTFRKRLLDATPTAAEVLTTWRCTPLHAVEGFLLELAVHAHRLGMRFTDTWLAKHMLFDYPLRSHLLRMAWHDGVRPELYDLLALPTQGVDVPDMLDLVETALPGLPFHAESVSHALSTSDYAYDHGPERTNAGFRLAALFLAAREYERRRCAIGVEDALMSCGISDFHEHVAETRAVAYLRCGVAPTKDSLAADLRSDRFVVRALPRLYRTGVVCPEPWHLENVGDRALMTAFAYYVSYGGKLTAELMEHVLARGADCAKLASIVERYREFVFGTTKDIVMLRTLSEDVVKLVLDKLMRCREFAFLELLKHGTVLERAFRRNMTKAQAKAFAEMLLANVPPRVVQKLAPA